MKNKITTVDLLENRYNKVLLSIKETADALGVSRSSVNNYINLEIHPLKCIKLGGTKKSALRIKIVDLASFIDGMESNKMEVVVWIIVKVVK